MPLNRLASLTFLAGFVLFGCSTAPDFDAVAAAQHIPSSTQSSEIVRKLMLEKPESDILARHLVLEESVAGTPLSAGNKVTLLQDGAATFGAFFEAIQNAKDHINLEFFIFEDIEFDGRNIIDLLLAKQKAGVQVNLIYDSIGSDQTAAEIFARLRDGGVQVHEYNPVIPLKDLRPKLYNPNHRDHRKILIVDGAIGFTGGINISKVYSGSSGGSGASSGSRKKVNERPEGPPEEWRDTQVRIEGPAVAQLQQLFKETWEHEWGEPLTGRNYFPKVADKGDEVLRIIGSNPDDPPPAFYITLLSVIRTAEEKIWIANPYFAPTKEEVEELEAAARRGVDVQILLQGKTDSPIVRNIARSTYADFLDAGVKIYELDGAILHAKTAVVDGVWSSVGSSNLDNRSVLFNTEVDAVILGRETATHMEERHTMDRAKAKRITPAEWSDRGPVQRTKEFFARFMAYWM